MGHWSSCLRNVDRKSSILSHKPQIDHEKHNERNYLLIQCEFSFPSDMSFGCKMFIKKALQKNPDQRFTIDSLLSDRFLSKHKQAY